MSILVLAVGLLAIILALLGTFYIAAISVTDPWALLANVMFILMLVRVHLWRVDRRAAEHEFIELVHPHPMWLWSCECEQTHNRSLTGAPPHSFCRFCDGPVNQLVRVENVL